MAAEFFNNYWYLYNDEGEDFFMIHDSDPTLTRLTYALLDTNDDERVSRAEYEDFIAKMLDENDVEDATAPRPRPNLPPRRRIEEALEDYEEE